MKKIVKARIGKCYNNITNEVEHQLQFKMEGERGFNGFSNESYTEDGAKAALSFYKSGELIYMPYARYGKYYLCRIAN